MQVKELPWQQMRKEQEFGSRGVEGRRATKKGEAEGVS